MAYINLVEHLFGILARINLVVGLKKVVPYWLICIKRQDGQCCVIERKIEGAIKSRIVEP